MAVTNSECIQGRKFGDVVENLPVLFGVKLTQ